MPKTTQNEQSLEQRMSSPKKELYRLQPKDFIPLWGLVNYGDRVGDDWYEGENYLHSFLRMPVLLVYNLPYWVGLFELSDIIIK